MTPKDQDAETLVRLRDSLEADVLRGDVYSDAEVDEKIRTAGGNPTAIGQWGTKLAAELSKTRSTAQIIVHHNETGSSISWCTGPAKYGVQTTTRISETTCVRCLESLVVGLEDQISNATSELSHVKVRLRHLAGVPS